MPPEGFRRASLASGRFPPPSYSAECLEGRFSEATRREGVLSVLRKRIGGERGVQGFLDGLVRSTKTVMTRVEFGGTLFLVAVIGVLLTSRKEGDESS